MYNTVMTYGDLLVSYKYVVKQDMYVQWAPIYRIDQSDSRCIS